MYIFGTILPIAIVTLIMRRFSIRASVFGFSSFIVHNLSVLLIIYTTPYGVSEIFSDKYKLVIFLSIFEEMTKIFFFLLYLQKYCTHSALGEAASFAYGFFISEIIIRRAVKIISCISSQDVGIIKYNVAINCHFGEYDFLLSLIFGSLCMYFTHLVCAYIVIACKKNKSICLLIVPIIIHSLYNVFSIYMESLSYVVSSIFFFFVLLLYIIVIFLINRII